MNKDCFIYNFLEEAAAKWPEKRAIIYDTFEVSYKQLFDDVVRKAIHMQRFQGQRVAIYGLRILLVIMGNSERHCCLRIVHSF